MTTKLTLGVKTESGCQNLRPSVVQKSVPGDQHLSSLGKPRDAKR